MRMTHEFIPINGQQPGVVAAMLRASYDALLKVDSRWEREIANWDAYDRDVFENFETVGACLFLTRINGQLAGFASWDPRQVPTYAVIGHNCILPAFQGRGLGRLQIQKILRRFHALGVETAKVSTCNHPFFVPAQRMYMACGFHEIGRTPWSRDPTVKIIEFEKGLDYRHICRRRLIHSLKKILSSEKKEK